jgi:hypothetical protein
MLSGMGKFLRGVVAGLLVAGGAAAPGALASGEARARILAKPGPTAAAGGFRAPLGHSYYQIHWGPMLVADGDLEVRQEGALVEVALDVRTRRVLDLLYRLHYRGEASLSANDGNSRESLLVRTRNGRLKEIHMDFAGDEVQVSQIKRRPDREPRIKEVAFPRKGGPIDPFAFLLRARSASWQVGQTREFRVVTGDDLWGVRLSCGERTTLAFEGEEREVWVLGTAAWEIDPELDDEPHSEDPDDGWIRDVTLYVSTEPARDLLELRIESRVGTVRARMKSPEPGSTGKTASLGR